MPRRAGRGGPPICLIGYKEKGRREGKNIMHACVNRVFTHTNHYYYPPCVLCGMCNTCAIFMLLVLLYTHTHTHTHTYYLCTLANRRESGMKMHMGRYTTIEPILDPFNSMICEESSMCVCACVCVCVCACVFYVCFMCVCVCSW